MNILDPKFDYVPAANTDLRKTFARVRKQQAAEKRALQEKQTAQLRALRDQTIVPSKLAAVADSDTVRVLKVFDQRRQEGKK